MKFKILSDVKLRNIAVVPYLFQDLKETAEAQKKHTLKQVIEWGNKKCGDYPEYGLKRECEICWAELEKEANSG